MLFIFYIPFGMHPWRLEMIVEESADKANTSSYTLLTQLQFHIYLTY